MFIEPASLENEEYRRAWLHLPNEPEAVVRFWRDEALETFALALVLEFRREGLLRWRKKGHTLHIFGTRLEEPWERLQTIANRFGHEIEGLPVIRR